MAAAGMVAPEKVLSPVVVWFVASVSNEVLVVPLRSQVQLRARACTGLPEGPGVLHREAKHLLSVVVSSQHLERGVGIVGTDADAAGGADEELVGSA